MLKYMHKPNIAIICSFCNIKTDVAIKAPKDMLKRNGEQRYICSKCIADAKEVCDADKSNK